VVLVTVLKLLCWMLLLFGFTLQDGCMVAY
jgi:hypothetical protein